MKPRSNPFRREDGTVAILDSLSPEVVMLRQPADARELTRGFPERYTMVPASTPAIPDILAELPQEDLVALARGVGIWTADQARSDIITRLTPLVEAREVQIAWISRAREDDRAALLKRLTRQMRRQDVPAEDLVQKLLQANRGRCRPPLAEAEVIRIAEMVFPPEDPADEPDWDARLFGSSEGA